MYSIDHNDMHSVFYSFFCYKDHASTHIVFYRSNIPPFVLNNMSVCRNVIDETYCGYATFPVLFCITDSSIFYHRLVKFAYHLPLMIFYEMGCILFLLQRLQACRVNQVRKANIPVDMMSKRQQGTI